MAMVAVVKTQFFMVVIIMERRGKAWLDYNSGGSLSSSLGGMAAWRLGGTMA